MGIFTYTATNSVNVSKLKDVDINIVKNVTTTVNLQGFLAEAEAFGDAVGPAGGGTGGPTTFRFTIDDFDGSGSNDDPANPPDDLSSIVLDNVVDGNPVVSPPTVIDDVSESGGPSEPCKDFPNDGPNFVLNVVGGPSNWTRTIEADLAAADQLQTEICYNCDAGHYVGGAGGGFGTSSFIYTPDDPTTDGIDVFGGRDNCNVTQLTFQYAADQDGAVIRFTFDSVDNAGAPIVVESDPLASTGDSSPNSKVDVTLAVDLDSDLENLIFSNLTSVRIDVVGVDDDGVDGPATDVPDLDLTLDCVQLVVSCPGGPGGGALAETLTAAQAIADFDPVNGLGFVEAFSESTAASDRGMDMDMMV